MNVEKAKLIAYWTGRLSMLQFDEAFKIAEEIANDIFTGAAYNPDSAQLEKVEKRIKHITRMRGIINTPLEWLDLSVRTFNSLKSSKFNTLGEIVEAKRYDLLICRNLGKKSMMHYNK